MAARMQELGDFLRIGFGPGHKDPQRIQPAKKSARRRSSAPASAPRIDASFASPRRATRTMRRPSRLATSARKFNAPFASSSARPAIGVRQEPSSAASKARSARTQISLAASLRAAMRARVGASSSRHSIPSAPWPMAGRISVVGMMVPASCSSPSRRSPAKARSVASTAPSRIFRNRVSTFPRKGWIWRSGRSANTCAWRRGDEVPTMAPRGRAFKFSAWTQTKTSRGSSRGKTQARVSPSGKNPGMSLIE